MKNYLEYINESIEDNLYEVGDVVFFVGDDNYYPGFCEIIIIGLNTNTKKWEYRIKLEDEKFWVEEDKLKNKKTSIKNIFKKPEEKIRWYKDGKLSENNTIEKKFVVNKNKFQLFYGDDLVAESGYSVEQPDKWFDEDYLTLFDIKTFENFQGKGFAKYLLEQIFNYVKNELKMNIITLIVYKNNNKAVNLYFKCGFEIFLEYDDSLSLIKKLK